MCYRSTTNKTIKDEGINIINFGCWCKDKIPRLIEIYTLLNENNEIKKSC